MDKSNWLKNPGIKSLEKVDLSDKIISVYGWTLEEWKLLFSKINSLAIELNCSCPNIKKSSLTLDLFKMAVDTNKNFIVKVPPINYEKIVEMAWKAGIKIFHACNTLPTLQGGLSGKKLLPISQKVVSNLRRDYPEMQIIGGGGITCKKDAQDYIQCGADHIAIATVLNNPLNWYKINNLV